jgi:hypothetical protein
MPPTVGQRTEFNWQRFKAVLVLPDDEHQLLAENLSKPSVAVAVREVKSCSHGRDQGNEEQRCRWASVKRK